MAKRNQRTGRGVAGKPGRRHELTDEAFERIEPLLPSQGRGGRRNDHRVTLNGMFWILNSGAQWLDLPERYGKWQSVYNRYRRWADEWLFDRIATRYEKLARHYLAMVKLAMIQRCLPLLDSSYRT